ncbi:Odorant receptor [Nesidiocoris tenuis]|uniref:Odorant receptor n=1 Tax=Nesidiocoris tenuis TaxID=355587 RepID=A0ABN7ADZ9_9HEMI|nr:Odorant receptor [Nesidiocoris tenuis]
MNTTSTSIIALQKRGEKSIRIVSDAKPMRRPSTDIFQTITSILKFHGVVRPEAGGLPMKFLERGIWLVNVYSLSILLSGIRFQDPSNITVTLESLTFLLVISPAFIMTAVCSLRKKRLFALFDRINHLLTEIENEFGPETLKAADRECRMVMWAHVALFVSCTPPPFIVAYYNYYANGVSDAAPYTINIPFGRKQNVNYNTFWQFCVFFYPIVGTVTVRVIMGTLAVSSTLIVEKTRWKFEQLTVKNNKELLRQAIRWHSEAIQIVKETNMILGVAFTAEALFSMAYICNATFMLFKYGMRDDKLIYKSVTVLFSFSCLPLYFCMSGHRISNEGDRLYWSMFRNLWYELDANDRKDLLLPSLIAKHGISWGYRKVVVFDMATYFFIVRQSYSFYALLSARVTYLGSAEVVLRGFPPSGRLSVNKRVSASGTDDKRDKGRRAGRGSQRTPPGKGRPGLAGSDALRAQAQVRSALFTGSNKRY